MVSANQLVPRSYLEITLSTTEIAKKNHRSRSDSFATFDIKWIASLSGLFTVMATLFGMYYHKGTLDGYGIPTQFFHIPLQDSLTLSHEEFLLLVSQILPTLFTNYHLLCLQSISSAIGVSLLAVLLLWIHKRERKGKSANARPWVSRHRAIPWSIAGSNGPILGLFVYFAPRVLIALSAAVAFLPVLGYYAGQANSNEFLKKSVCSFDMPISPTNRCSRILRTDTSESKTSEERSIQGNI